MNITADTNILVRAVVNDDPAQGAKAAELLSNAALIAVPLPVLCEFVWVLRWVYQLSTVDIATAIRALLAADNVRANKLAVEQGLKLLEAGGDFADGVIVFEGQWLGGEVFYSFDKKAVKLLVGQGDEAVLLG